MISYEPLRILLLKEKMKMNELVKNKIVTADISVTLNNDTGNVSLTTIDKVMNYLSKELGRTVAIDEILEFIPDPEQDL